MTTSRTRLAITLTTIVGVLRVSSPGYAGPVIIRDEMISDRGLTPSLGRGYSIATNSFQSICLAAGFKTTTPSYDFVYSFESMEGIGYTIPDILTVAQGDTSQAPLVTITVPKDGSVSEGGDKFTVGAPTEKHYIKVSIAIDVYYHSIHEGGAALSEAAAKLLEKKDLPGFFDACGVYYTRSITRRGTYLSLFSYETKTGGGRDRAFEQSLKDYITGFGSAPKAAAKPAKPGQANAAQPGQANAGQADTGSSPTGALNPAPPPQSVSWRSLQQEFQSKKTTIRSYGFGLGKTETPTGELVAYDLDTFKKAAVAALTAMQETNAGIVTAIEVVPWVENLSFQEKFVLAKDAYIDDPRALPAAPAAPGADPATPVPTAFKLSISPYAQKRILSQNSEFLSEIDRASRNRLLNYYRAKTCRATIDRNYGTKVAGQLEPLAATRKLVNNRTRDSKASPTLDDLYKKELNDAKLSELGLEYENFTYTRAQTCLNVLLSSSFTIQLYREMPACKSLEQEFVVASSRDIDDYCLPTLGPPAATAAAGAGASSATAAAKP